MKILSPIIAGSGVEVYHQRLAAGVAPLGIQTILCPLSPRWEFIPWAFRWHFSRQQLKHKPYELIHTSTEYGCLLDSGKAPLVVTLHHSSVDEEILKTYSLPVRIHHRQVLKPFLKKTLSRAEKIIAVSHATRDQICQVFQKEISMEVIYNGIDPSRFYPMKLRPAGAEQPIVLFFSGNASRRKGFDLLDPLMKRLGLEFELRYTTGLRDRQKSRLSAVNSLHLGYLPEERLIQEINHADIVVQPSRREGFGLSILEAMACGKPVVSTHCSAIPEVLDHERGGYLCEPGSVEQLAKAVVKLAQSLELRHQMGEYNRQQVVQRFALRQMAEKHLRVYQSVAGKDSNGLLVGIYENRY